MTSSRSRSTTGLQFIQLWTRRTKPDSFQQIWNDDFLIYPDHIMTFGRKCRSSVISSSQCHITKLFYQMKIIVGTHEMCFPQILITLSSGQRRSSNINLCCIFNQIIQRIDVDIGIIPQLPWILVVSIILFEVIISNIRTTIAACYVIFKFIGTGIHQSMNTLFCAISRTDIGINRIQSHPKPRRSRHEILHHI
ncbi:unknown [Bacteroides sp. CAG:530]|nr:unknown [Bacteroides sp. CAG:530]